MEAGYARPYRAATARRCALRAAALRRFRAGATQHTPRAEALAVAVAAHHAATWRLATRALEALGTRMPGLERPPSG
eukprot:11911352-Alexandrium_andersonii.AAC.1